MQVVPKMKKILLITIGIFLLASISAADSCSYSINKYGIFYGSSPADAVTGQNPLSFCNANSGSCGWTNADCQAMFDGFNLLSTSSAGNFIAKYDYFGNQMQVADEEGMISTVYYDTLGHKQPYAIYSKDNGWTYLSKDPSGKILEIIDPKLNKAANEYDAYGRLLDSYYYDAIETLNYHIHYCYDTDCGGTPCYDYSVSSSTSSFNLLCEVQDNSGSTKFTYDEKSRIVSKQKTISDAATGDVVWDISYTYNPDDTLKTLTLPDASIITYNYNALGQVIDIFHAGTKIAHLTYEDFGGIDTKNINPNAANNEKINSDHTYNNKDQLTYFTHDTGSGTNLLKRYMNYDLVGNIDDIGYTGASSNDEDYVYDNIYRLRSATYAGDKTFNYHYKNVLGDRSSIVIDGVTTTYQYDPTRVGRLASTTGGASPISLIQYDDSGNIQSLTQDGSIKGFDYDTLNRMTTYAIGNQGPLEHYSYDYANQRVKKKSKLDDITTFYLYQGNNIIYEEYYEGCPVDCGDIDGSGTVDYIDLSRAINRIFGTDTISAGCGIDVDGSGEANYEDLKDIYQYIKNGAGTLNCGEGAIPEDPTNENAIEDFIAYMQAN